MQLLALLAIQALAVILIVGNSPQSNASRVVRHAIKQVLGTTYLAQDATDQTPPADQTQPQETQPPAEQQTQSQPTQEPQQQQQPQTTEQPTSVEPTAAEQPTEAPVSPETLPLTETPTPEGQLDSQQTADTLNNSTALPLINTDTASADTSVASTENISTDVTDQTERNDTAIDEATTPEGKSSNLLNSEQEDLNLLTTTVRNDNYTSASFLTQRLITNLQTLSDTLPTATNKTALQSQMVALCNQTDTQLRTQQLAVPEELEQDIEIARSLCR